MGTDAEVFVFDHKAYIEVVVPAFNDLLRAGKVADWLRSLLKRRELKPWLWDKKECAHLYAALNPDFSWVGPYDLNQNYDEDWDQRWTTSFQTFDRNTPLNLKAPPPDVAEQINWLFEIGVSVKTLGRSQFVGRSTTVDRYSALLRDLGVKEEDRLVALLAALGKRGFIIGFQFGTGFEGINGWLQPSETVELADRLQTLPLPQYEASFAATERFRMTDTGEYVCPGFTFEALSLSFVRTAATIAAREDRGLLWGNGVMPPEYYQDPHHDALTPSEPD